MISELFGADTMFGLRIYILGPRIFSPVPGPGKVRTTSSSISDLPDYLSSSVAPRNPDGGRSISSFLHAPAPVYVLFLLARSSQPGTGDEPAEFVPTVPSKKN